MMNIINQIYDRNHLHLVNYHFYVHQLIMFKDLSEYVDLFYYLKSQVGRHSI